MNSQPSILILTPVKNGVDCLQTYLGGLLKLSYPHRLVSIGILESDSTDGSFKVFEQACSKLGSTFSSAQIWKRDFGFQIPDGLTRWEPQLQSERRSILAKSRNHLLFRALQDHDWVLWLDVDVIEYPANVIEHLLGVGKDIVHPHCVLEYGGRTFDLNAWRDHGKRHMSDLRAEGDVVELDAVGGTMLLIRADVHREGLIFPTFHLGPRISRARWDNKAHKRRNLLGAWMGHYSGEIETEGLGIMAHEMGHKCFGLPNFEIRHRDA